MGLKQMAVVHGDWPIIAKSVLARVPKTTVIAEGEVGVLIHVHLLKQTTKALQTRCNQLGKKNGKSGTKASSNKKKQIWDYSVGILPLS
jgi:hypothetical protein